MARKRRRARLQLGPGGMIYVVVTALILATAIYTQANLLFWSFGLMVGGLVVSLLVAWQTLHNVHVQRLPPGHGVAGDMMVLRYHVQNRSWLPIFSLVIMETWGRGRRGWKHTGPIAEKPPMLRGQPHGWILHLGPNQTIQAEAPCWPLRRGTLQFERIVLYSSFPFGIVRKVVDVQQTNTVLVYPHLARLNRRLIYSLSNFDPSGKKQMERGGGMEEFFGLRPYREGDSLKMIDWKHTARTGELVSREMTQPSPPRIMILLDLRDVDRALEETQRRDEQQRRETSERREKRRRRREARRRHRQQRADRPHASASQRVTDPLTPKQRAIERTISLAASMICEAHFQGYQVGLAAAGCAFVPFPVHHSLPHRTRILEALAQLDPDDPERSGDMLPAQPSVIIWPGPGGQESGGGGSPAVFGAADLERYVIESDGGERLLRRRNRPKARREEMVEQSA